MSLLETKTVRYKITYGGENQNNRNSKSFLNEKEAMDFFDEKDLAGLHVDAFMITSTTTIEVIKLS